MNSLIFGLVSILAIFSHQIAAQSCGECVIVVSFIETWVESNATETQIAQYLDVACTTIFSAEEAVCESIISSGLTEIITYLDQNETPTQICTTLSFCTSKNTAGPIRLAKPVHKIDTPVKQTAECSECEEFVNYIEQWMENSDNEADIVTTVEVLCTYFPEWESACDTFVEYGVDDVIKYIEKEENATVVCNQVGACGATSASCGASVAQTECTGCEYIIGFVENWVASNASVTQIESYLDAICPYLPDYSTQCTQVISTEVPFIVQQLENQETPAAICSSLGLCSSTKKN